MIQRKFNDVLSAWHGLVEELAYRKDSVGAVSWGVCIGYPELIEVSIADALLDNKMHLGMSSYTKSRWTRFLRRYFRPDLREWVRESVRKLTKYPNRPFVASYSINLNVHDEEGRAGHNYGGCLSSLQIRVHPKPTVILYSRACQMDKIGFLDLCLIHLVAKELRDQLGDHVKVRGTWVVSLAFISAISQVYYANRFKKKMNGHALRRRIEANRGKTNSPFGPLSRLLKRNRQLAEFGEIPRSCPVSELSLDFELNP